MKYQSEIRQSVINELLEKVEKQNYGKYLSKVKLVRLRSFINQSIKLDFPVTALIGPNGGGKTTILGACACVYADMRPRKFFAKNKQFDEAMKEWSVEYEVVDKNINPRDLIKRTLRFTQQKWTRDAIKREVLHFGVERTLPAVEKIQMLRFTASNFHASKEQIIPLLGEMANAIQCILGKQINDYSMISMNPNGEVDLLTGITNDGKKYSEFHFGAGESSIIKMVVKIEKMKDNSLILIEEIENGLHPLAVIRLVEYLIDVAKRKSSQVIFTTHSDDTLIPLPYKAVWSAIDGTVFQGKLSISSLRSILGQVDSKLIIFAEDQFAKEWVETIIESTSGVACDAIEVYPMAGDGTAVNINKHHNDDPSAKHIPSVCFIDGDSEQKENKNDKVYRLPGQCPEAHVYDKVVDDIETMGPQLAISLLKDFEDTERIVEIVKSTRLTNRDPHLLYSQVGKKLGFISEQIVRKAFMSFWCKSNVSEVKRLMSYIEDILPKNLLKDEDAS